MTWAGLLAGFGVLLWGVFSTGSAAIFINAHGIVMVLGGTLFATMLNTTWRNLMRAMRQFFEIFISSRDPEPADCIARMVDLAQRAAAGGGIMALGDVDGEYASGFLRRAITVANVTEEPKEIRYVLEEEVRQRRLVKLEGANLFRTAGVLFPMFGLLGTLLGIIEVLKSIQDPAKIGGAMAIAITTAFYGIGLSNLICVPVANKIRNRAIEEQLIQELILESVLAIVEGKAPRVIELRLRGYLVARGLATA